MDEGAPLTLFTEEQHQPMAGRNGVFGARARQTQHDQWHSDWGGRAGSANHLDRHISPIRRPERARGGRSWDHRGADGAPGSHFGAGRQARPSLSAREVGAAPGGDTAGLSELQMEINRSLYASDALVAYDDTLLSQGLPEADLSYDDWDKGRRLQRPWAHHTPFEMEQPVQRSQQQQWHHQHGRQPLGADRGRSRLLQPGPSPVRSGRPPAHLSPQHSTPSPRTRAIQLSRHQQRQAGRRALYPTETSGLQHRNFSSSDFEGHQTRLPRTDRRVRFF